MAKEYKAGDSNQITREYFNSLLLEMRHIDSVKPSTSMKLYGKEFKTPIMTAALSHLNNQRENGMVEMAKGAKQAGAVMWTGMGDKEELEDEIKTGAEVIKIIKPYKNNDDIYEKIEHAQKHGAFAIGIDLDHSFDKNGDYDNVLGLEMRPKTFKEIRDFVDSTDLPFIIKGVLSKKDAYKALEAGVRGIVVSHHHGIMDYALPPLVILPELVELIDGQIPIFVDCGISSGMDAFKSLALGADAVCAGRVLMNPLKEKGAEGVCELIEKMNNELKGAMARTGSANIEKIDPAIIWRKY